jgi:hypothetical protein
MQTSIDEGLEIMESKPYEIVRSYAYYVSRRSLQRSGNYSQVMLICHSGVLKDLYRY